MRDPQEFVDLIYEAAVLPQLWPEVLEGLARACGAQSGALFTSTISGVRWVVGPSIQAVMEAYVAEGWMAENARGAPLLRALHPGFLTDGDVFTPEQKAAMPVYTDFFARHGVNPFGAGTVIQGAEHDAMILTIEGFASQQAAHANVPALDRLRPHLARAVTISGRLQAVGSRAIVDGLATLGASAAVVTGTGRLLAANAGFDARMANEFVTRRGGAIGFLRAEIDRQFAALLAGDRARGAAPQSLVIRPVGGGAPFVLHAVPLRGSARDVFNAEGFVLVIADGANVSLPGSDLLRLLFDLTPAEARLARALLEGHTLSEAAAGHGIKSETARSQLKAIFAKTGVNRQGDLTRLLSGYGAAASGAGS